ncbi:hypothetical protein [Thiohalophilus sp.]|uniref:hypothetical protein n=1 Tax=Thiohalophilus sp. TaxID=3028392 RepID=UPI002ACDFF93|nr:hypothetical protein [Thiohalophilus sp.]MDZ7803341.1 hypothetical protein [Thiohalophilus sp.]
MSQIPNFAGERSKAREVALQARVADDRFSAQARELTQWAAALREHHGVHFMAADFDRQCNKLNGSDQ